MCVHVYACVRVCMRVYVGVRVCAHGPARPQAAVEPVGGPTGGHLLEASASATTRAASLAVGAAVPPEATGLAGTHFRRGLPAPKGETSAARSCLPRSRPEKRACDFNLKLKVVSE